MALEAARHLLARWRASLPSECAICRRWPAQRLCQPCCAQYALMVPRCQHCALALPGAMDARPADAAPPVCAACLRRQPPMLDSCVAAVDYAWPWRAIIADFKFHGDFALARSLAALMLQVPQARALLVQCDALLPMPLSRARLRERGFDQTLLLARALAAQVPIALLAHAVLRQHSAQAQHQLSRARRLRQLRTAFTVAAGQHGQIAARRVLLLDDVMTTGASLYALATCLRQAGAAQVHALVLARTPAPGR